MDDSQSTTAALSAPSAARELVVCWQDHVERFELSGTAVVVGRGDGCQVRVQHASVSRTHVRLHFGDRGVEIEDLGSANGTRVDGIQVAGRAPLAVGSIAELGAVRLLLCTRAGSSPIPSPMTEVRRLAEKFASTPLSLILLGETGVGKEVMAEEIHARSRGAGPLVRVNCAGLSATLIESELFGHERGAFTGATHAKPGLIEAAHGGTLFLDELGEMPEATQPKLLRVLESRTVRRVGAVQGRPVDVRFVSATHRDLNALTVMGKFREDLLFRLNGFALRIPPLRERRDEVIELATGFLASASERGGTRPPRLSDAARALLLAYRFPGNIRELRNVIERAALVCDGDSVLTEHLLFGTLPSPAAAVPSAPPPPAVSDAEAAGERERIVRALTDAGGNQAAAAEALGMTRRMLGYRMDKLALPRPRRK